MNDEPLYKVNLKVGFRKMAAKARTGCQPCRIRHLKCDQGTPTCGRCESAGRECTKAHPYRIYKNKFLDDQTWLSTPNELTFIDETQGVVDSFDDYETDSEGESPPKTRRTESSLTIDAVIHPENESPVSHSPSHMHLTSGIIPKSTPHPSRVGATSPVQALPQHGIPTSRSQGLAQTAIQYGPHLPSPDLSTTKAFTEQDAPSISLYPETPSTFQDSSPSTFPSIYLDEPVWPLTDPAEANLLRHFVQNLAIWLDLCDPQQHFQVEVPRRAGTCPILLNAIFALSARHLSHVGNYDAFAHNRYHDECLKYLIPMLNNHATITDETLFAATIILRVLEEIDLPESDIQSHMLGIQVFVSASARDHNALTMRGGLSEAAFWVGLRQEIYSAMMKHQSIQLQLPQILIDRSFEPTSDFGWANRGVVHCADVLNCCFGPAGVSLSHWLELKEASERWSAEKPSSFRPIYWREAERGRGDAFPEIWHSHACHIIGVQHHKLGQILLSIFDPRIPRVGGARSVAVRSMEEQIKSDLRELCGIGLYNRWTPPGMFTASMGIAICGDRFEDKVDQDALLDILVRTERDHARPTAAVQKQMKESWGWMTDN